MVSGIKFMDFGEDINHLSGGLFLEHAVKRLKHQDTVVANVGENSHHINRDQGTIVVLSEVVGNGNLFLEDPDDRESDPIDKYVFTHCRRAAEQLLLQVIAQYN